MEVVVVADNQAVHHYFDAVFEVLLQVKIFFQAGQPTIHPHSDETSFSQIFKHLLVLSLTVFNHRSQDLNFGSLGFLEYLGYDLTGSLRGYGFTTLVTVGQANPCI